MKVYVLIAEPDCYYGCDGELVDVFATPEAAMALVPPRPRKRAPLDWRARGDGCWTYGRDTHGYDPDRTHRIEGREVK
jgi:hypothetical protein